MLNWQMSLHNLPLLSIYHPNCIKNCLTIYHTNYTKNYHILIMPTIIYQLNCNWTKNKTTLKLDKKVDNNHHIACVPILLVDPLPLVPLPLSLIGCDPPQLPIGAYDPLPLPLPISFVACVPLPFVTCDDEVLAFLGAQLHVLVLWPINLYFLHLLCFFPDSTSSNPFFYILCWSSWWYVLVGGSTLIVGCG